MSTSFAGKLADPEFRKRRARQARAAQGTVDYHIQKLVDAAPPLTAAQRDKLASLLRPSAAHSGASPPGAARRPQAQPREGEAA